MAEPDETDHDAANGSVKTEPGEPAAPSASEGFLGSESGSAGDESGEPGAPKGAAGSDKGDLDALLSSLNGSAERLQTLWFSFLGLTLYLAIAALATTHRNLLLGEPQTLPILNIKVQLLPFYIIAPLLYFVFHFYLLMMLVLLARTAAPFESELRKTLKRDVRERYRARVENALFLQLLVGMKTERAGFSGALLAAIGLITIVLAPLATLILIQMMFLPYHSVGITWWHRCLVVADMVLLGGAWLLLFYGRRSERPVWRQHFRYKLRGGLSLALCVVAFVPALWLSFWEGRWAGEPLIGRADYAATKKGVVFGWFPDRLQLPNETIVGKSRVEDTEKEIASRGGDWVPTINLDHRDLQAAELTGADLRGVSLNDAVMRGAVVVYTQLDNAQLIRVQLQDSNLSNAWLRGTDFSHAQLQGADLGGAQLQGANLEQAELQGANLQQAQLKGADLGCVRDPDLECKRGADLLDVQLQGADLSYAQLQGANLRRAQLQGADLRGADLSDSELDRTFVFRTDISDANLATAAIRSIEADKVKPGGSGKTAPLADADIDRWIAAATAFAREGDKAEITKRFARLKPDFREAPYRRTWGGLEEASRALDPSAAEHRRRLADRLGELACDERDAPYVAQRLMYGRLASLGDQLEGVRKHMKAGRKKPDDCKGVAGFTERNWRWLEEIKPVQSPTASGTDTPPAAIQAPDADR